MANAVRGTASSVQADTVGLVISKVEDDLKRLIEEVHKVGCTSDDPHVELLENTIKKTHSEVKAYSDRVLYESQNDAKELPPINAPAHSTNVRGMRPITELVQQHRSYRMGLLRHKSKAGALQQSVEQSPGEVVKNAYVDKLLSHPQNQASKQFISERYGITLAALKHAPLFPFREGAQPAPVKPHTGLTVAQLPVLPLSKRGDNLFTPPTILEDDSRKGLLSMLERGLIPITANIVMNPPPIKPKASMIHAADQHHIRRDICDDAEIKHFPLVKLDLREPEELCTEHKAAAQRLNIKPKLAVPSTESAVNPAVAVSTCSSEAPPSQPRATLPFSSSGTQCQPSPSTEEFYISVHKGEADDTTPEFHHFKQKHASNWGNIAALLHQCKALAFSYAIPLIIVDAAKLAKLGERFEVEFKPTHKDFLKCMVNASDVERMLFAPGRRFRGAGGHSLAAARIQATYRMFKGKQEYLYHRKQRVAAGIIAMGWLLHVKARSLKKHLQAKRATQRINFLRRARELQKKWDSYKTSPHVVIHIPSLGYPEALRDKSDLFHFQQKAQTGRIGYLSSPQVEIIYISPVEVSDELKDYYCKLLLLGMEQDSSLESMRQRLTIITPDKCSAFRSKNLSLASILLYSPRTIARIKNLIKGKDAYIVPGVVSDGDLALADELGVPVLGTDPQTVHLYSNKTAGAVKLFTEAKVPIPPSALDVYSEIQVIHRLSHMVISHLSVQRWCFKLNVSVQGSGIAYCDILVHLPCYRWLLKEREQYASEWGQKWVQEIIVDRVSAELPDVLEKHSELAHASNFTTWKKFMHEMKKTGGVIQACPPPDSTTAITVNLLLEPSGNSTILCAADQINPRPFWKWGVSVPQSSICLSHLTEEVSKAASALQERGVVGYVTLDFVTFISPITMEQDLWAVDLDIGMTSSQSMYCLLLQITGGSFSWRDGTFSVRNPPKETESRYAVMSTQLFHESLSVVQCNVFLHLCKAHFIGYNIEDRVGSVFTIPDSSDRRHMGIICIEDSLSKTMTTLAHNLSTIHQEVAVTSDAGTNFKDISEELHRIAADIDL